MARHIKLLCLCLGLISMGQHAKAQDDDAPIQCFQDGTFTKDDYPYCKELSTEYALHWKISSGMITYGIAVAGKYAMIGLGISDSGGMRGSDMMILLKEESVTAGTAWRIGDYWSTDFVTPTKDDQQDYTLLSYAGTAQITTAEVQRQLQTNDLQQDIQIYYDTDQLVVFAYGTSGQLAYHGPTNRGWQVLRLHPANYNATLNVTGLGNSSSFNFANSTEYTYRMAVMAQDPKDLAPLNIKLPQVPVNPVKGISHQCYAVAVPKKAKYHVFRYQGVPRTVDGKGALVPSTDPPLVSSMRLYGCTSQPDELTAYDCDGVPNPACNIPFGFWGDGMISNFSLPLEAGLPFGKGAGLVTFMMLVVEHNNVQGATDLVDSSGFTLYYSPQLRPFDLGILRLGNTNGPWNSSDPSKALDNWCAASCTARLPYNITLVSNYLSMDKNGQAIITRHISNSNTSQRVEIQPLGSKLWWWMGWQSFKQVLPQSRSLQPGDTLTTYCNTSSGPLATCLNYLHYYPAIPGWTDCYRMHDTNLSTCNITATFNLTATTANTTLPNNIAALATTLVTAYTTLLSNATQNATTVSNVTLLTPSDVQQLSILTAQGLASLGSLPSLLNKLDYTLLVSGRFQNGSIAPAQIPSPAAIPTAFPALQEAVQGWAMTGLTALSVLYANSTNSSLNSNSSLSLNQTSMGNGTDVSFGTLLPMLLSMGGMANTNGSSNSSLGVVAAAALANVSVATFTALLQADYLLQLLPVAMATAVDVVYTPYVEGYVPPEPLPPPHYETGAAAAAIILVSIGMFIVIGFLWVNYARKEDPERQALLAALQQTILEEAAKHPDLSEDELRVKLQDQVRKKLLDDGVIQA